MTGYNITMADYEASLELQALLRVCIAATQELDGKTDQLEISNLSASVEQVLNIALAKAGHLSEVIDLAGRPATLGGPIETDPS